ncbi:hypothetical protein AGDE_14147 [Angomonas deanei]|uniref:Uncharacterized protein n=1 Tax=Angomonas deanei TaxID=59799 RepID=A0A7G2C1X6_9TRYP|nr:hypothetical protein AGDE_14147 [Angomonas deanei]CAD2212733.1 hypothetical protein, conserved [Angomonas deanei]|eukprot:EPY21344.1 hypothetical protein AGDE_14147 [Angomonas deanei]
MDDSDLYDLAPSKTNQHHLENIHNNYEHLQKVWQTILDGNNGNPAVSSATLGEQVYQLLHIEDALEGTPEEKAAAHRVLSDTSYQSVVNCKKDHFKEPCINSFEDFLDYYSVYTHLHGLYRDNEGGIREEVQARHGAAANLDENNLKETAFYPVAVTVGQQLAAQLYSERGIAPLPVVAPRSVKNCPTSLLHASANPALRREIGDGNANLQLQYETQLSLPSDGSGSNRDELLLFAIDQENERGGMTELDPSSDFRKCPMGLFGLIGTNALSQRDVGSAAFRNSKLFDYVCGNYPIWSNFTKILLTENKAFASFRESSKEGYASYRRAMLALGNKEGVMSYENYLFELWLTKCVKETNTVIGRGDLNEAGDDGGEAYVHWTDARYLFEYMNLVNLLVTCCGKNEELLASLSSGGLSEESMTKLRQNFSTILEEALSTGANKDLILKDMLRSNYNGLRDRLLTLYTGVLQQAGGAGGNRQALYLPFAQAAAALFVGETRDVSERAVDLAVLEVEEDDHLDTMEESEVQRMANSAWPWSPLALLLPRGRSASQRERRQILFHFLDAEEKGYVMVSNLEGRVMRQRRQSLHVDRESENNCFLLSRFRRKEENVVALLWRSFVMTKELVTLPEYNLSSNRTVIERIASRTGERVLEPAELKAFVSYIYLYFEYYYMFDLLLVWGTMEKEARQSLSAMFVQGGAQLTNAGRYIRETYEQAYQRTFFSVEATAYELTEKFLSVDHFTTGKPLLEFFGFHVHESSLTQGPDAPFAAGEQLNFTNFVIFASKNRIHPQGYGFYYSYCSNATNSAEVNKRIRELEQTIVKSAKR